MVLLGIELKSARARPIHGYIRVMLTLLYSLLVLMVVGLAVTACALIAAKDGYEDSLGFHPTVDGTSPDSTPLSSRAAIH